MLRAASLVLLSLSVVACGDDGPSPADIGGPGDLPRLDAQPPDLGDAGVPEMGPPDSGPADSGPEDHGPEDLGPEDLGESDLGRADLGESDLAVSMDMGPNDLGAADGGVDAGPGDGGPVDQGPAGPPVGARWTWARNQVTTRREGNALAAADGSAFVLGGRVVQCGVDGQRYDPWLDRWQNVPGSFGRPPITAALDRYVFAFEDFLCGLTPGNGDRYEIRDALTGHVRTFRMPQPRYRSGLSFTSAGIFLVSGDSGCLDSRACDTNPYLIDPETGGQTALSTMGAPIGGGSAVGWTGTELIVYGGSAASSGIYTLATDRWRPLPLPSPALTPVVSADTGSSLLVYGGGQGARYDYATGRWRGLATAGAPPQTPRYQEAWTGTEWIVMWASGGAHYDPIGDSWRPVNPTFAQWTTGPVAWTGRELLVFSLGTSSRYGPSLTTSSTTCTGLGPGGLEVEITRPTTRVVVSGTLPTQSRTGGPEPVSTLQWSVDGVPAGTGVSPSIDVSGLSAGQHELRLDATSLTGNRACHTHTIFSDAPPRLEGVRPAPGSVILGSRARFQGRCQDDRSSCRAALRVGNETFGPVGSVNEEILFSGGQVGVWVPYTIAAVDDRQQRDQRLSAIVPVIDPTATATATLDRAFCDVRDGYALVIDPSGEFAVRNLATGRDQLIGGRNATCERGAFLLASGRAATTDSIGSGRYWDGTATTRTWNGNRHRARGNFVVYASGGRLTRLDVSTGTELTVSAADLHPTHRFDLDENGVVYWREATDSLQRWTPAGNTQLATALGTDPDIVAFTSGALWRQRSGSTWSIVRYEGSTNVTANLVLGATAWGNFGPEAGRDYFGAGGYVGFTAELAGTLQVLRAGPGAGASALTTATRSAQLLSVETDGDLWVVEDDVTRRYPATGTPVTLWQVATDAAYPNRDRSVLVTQPPSGGGWSMVDIGP